MQKCGKKDLLAARNAAGMSREEAAPELGVSSSTIRDWEDDKIRTKPGPDDVWRMEKLYGVPGLWRRWMQSHYDSYLENHPEETVGRSTLAAVVNVRHQLADVMALSEPMERDAMDGRIENEPQRMQYLRELDEAEAAIVEARRALRDGNKAE